MPRDKPKLDSGAKGGLAGQVVVAALFVVLVVWQSARPVACGALMAAVGLAAMAVTWRAATRWRRYFSAVQWLTLSGLFLACYAVLQIAPTAELRQFYAEEPSRRATVLVIAAVLAVIGTVSMAMLRQGGGPKDN